MNFKNITLKELITSLLISLTYPIIKGIIDKNHLVAFVDSLTIIGCIALIIGVFTSAVLHGDYDIASYLAHKKKFNDTKTSFKEYYDSQNEKRKDRFNYPLFIGILFLLTSIILAMTIA